VHAETMRGLLDGEGLVGHGDMLSSGPPLIPSSYAKSLT
jgi:hypothetical protein